MPELPEIETVRLQLQKVLVGQTCAKALVLSARVVKSDLSKIENKKVLGIERLGKVLLINFGNDLKLGFHFKMTGQLVYEPKTQKLKNSKLQRIAGGHPSEDMFGDLPNKHTRIIFDFDQGKLFFNDMRLFAWVEINPEFVEKLGPEPMAIEDTKFIKILSELSMPIKTAIMDQELIAGVGNIYVNDALWMAKINPRLATNKLTAERLKTLHRCLCDVLTEAIALGGSSMRDYVDSEGKTGGYQDHFKVYKQEGKTCKACKTGIVEKMVISGRGTYYCPVCQSL